MPNIKVKGQAGNVLTFENVERVLFDSADDNESTVPFSYGDVIEISPITLELGDGDQTVTAPDGTLLRSVQISQPSTLKPENIRKGVFIAGVQGSLINDTEEVTVELNFPVVETDIFQGQRVEFDDYGMAVTNSIGLVEGEKYFVVWGGTEYVATGMLLESPNLTGVYIGNLSLSGEGEVTDYPFLIGDSGENTYIFSGDIASPDTIRVYQKIGDGSPDQVVLPSDEEKAMSKVTIKKPETLVPSNIANGVEIGGVTGKFIGNTEETTVDLNFAESNQQEVTPSADGKVLSKVTIKKPDALLPENIAKGVEIAGIAGEFSGGGDVDLMAEEILKYFAYKVDSENRQIILCKLAYAKAYEETGVYLTEISVPDNIAGYSVVIDANFE